MQKLLSSISAWSLKQAYHETLNDVLSHVPIAQRLDRAYEILTQNSQYTIELVTGMPCYFLVTGPNGIYTVVPAEQRCSCPDSEALCKHRLAVKLILKALEYEKE